MKIGFHFPFSGGLVKLKDRITESRGNTYQIFARGLRGGELKPLKQNHLDDLLTFQNKKKINPVFIHAPYVYNLANLENEDETRVLEDLEYAKCFRAPYYVINPGRYVNQHPLQAMENIKYQLWDILNQTDWMGEILIKNTRGSGTELAYDLRDWSELIGFHPRVKGCLDFARLFTSGYEFRSENQAYDLVETIEDYIGWDNIKMVYINDTHMDLGTRKEDKEPPPLGEGLIGFNGYYFLLQHPVIQQKIWLIENTSESKYYYRTYNYLLPFFDNKYH